MAGVEAGPRVFAVIPVHNRVEQTLRCLGALEAGTAVPDAIVVDDGSTDGTAEVVKDRFPETVVLAADGNQWWAGATNIGVHYALDRGADFVLILNNDGVLDAQAVEGLLAAATTNGSMILSASRRDLDDPARPRRAGVAMHWGWRRFYRGVPVAGTEPIAIDATGANAMLVPRRCFEVVGPFDARRLPHAWADWDFQLRARAQGWPLRCIPGSVVLEDTTTRGPRLAKSLSPRQAFALLTSRASIYRPPYLWRFLRRHAPPGRAPVLLLCRYARLPAAVVQHWLKRAKDRPGDRCSPDAVPVR